MLVLFDQGTPLRIREFLKQHRAETAVRRGWDKLKGALAPRLYEKPGRQD
jgi:hypothetical protein